MLYEVYAPTKNKPASYTADYCIAFDCAEDAEDKARTITSPSCMSPEPCAAVVSAYSVNAVYKGGKLYTGIRPIAWAVKLQARLDEAAAKQAARLGKDLIL